VYPHNVVSPPYSTSPFSSARPACHPPQVSKLDNGVRVATESQPWTSTATVAVTIDTGSRFEDVATNGVAHMLEHLNFKGTKRFTRHQIETAVENAGGQLNAFTSREHTCFTIKAERAAIPPLLEVLSDMLTSSNIEPAAVENERGVILEEMSHVYQQPNEVVFDHLHSTAFQQTPLGFTILGPTNNIRSITADQMKAFRDKHYTGPRVVVSGAGAITHDELTSLAKVNFGHLAANGPSTASLVAGAPAHFTGSEVRIRDPDSKETHFAVAVEGCANDDPDYLTLEVMRVMLGEWSTEYSTGMHSGSHLAQKVAAAGLGDRFFAFNTTYHDTGLFGIYASGPSDTTKDLAWAVMRYMNMLCYDNHVSELDLNRAKAMLKAERFGLYKNNESVAVDMGAQLARYGRRITMDETLGRIDAITVDDVNRVAKRFLYDTEVAISAFGETRALPEYQWFRRRTFQLRY